MQAHEDDGRNWYTWERFCGTIAYSAPEISSDRYRAGPADVWAIGLMLSELLTGCFRYERLESVEDLEGLEVLDTRSLAARSVLMDMCLRMRADERATIEEIMGSDWLRDSWGIHRS